MSTSLRRASVSALSALAIVLTALVAVAAPSGAAQGFTFERYAGANRFDTARLIAIDTFGTADHVLIATGVNFPDALAGSYLAGSTGTGAPILLVLPTAIPAETDAAITSLRATKATILGGPAAVSETVANQLRARGLTVDRAEGLNRYETAKAVALRPGAANVGTVDNDRTAIVATGRVAADALAGGPLAYAGKLPTLLTEPDSLVQPTRDALTQLNIRRVLLLGGPAAVSENVRNQLAAMNITVVRLEGTTRQATATAIAAFAKDKLAFDNSHVNLARGDDFADALTMGPHGGKDRSVIVLTGNPGTLTETTRAYLAANCSTLTTGHIAGGEAAVSATVAQEATTAAASCAPVNRATVTTTSSSVAQGGQITGTHTGNNVQSVTVTGCGLNQAVTRNANGNFTLTVPTSQAAGQCTLTFTTTFTDNATETDTVPMTVTAAQQNFAVTPTAAATQTNGTNRSFTATGLGTTPIDIALFRCENVTTDAGGTVFTQSPNSSGAATQGSPTSTITVVNGAANPATSAGNGGTVINNVAPQNGQVTFTITGPTGAGAPGECVIPVIFSDTNTNNTLDVNTTTGRPTETFEVGGRTTFLPNEASSGTFTASDVRVTDKVGNQFSACLITGASTSANPTAEPTGGCATYLYDNNDTYTLNGVTNSVGLAAFEAALSANDDVSGTYATDPAGVSNFNLTDEAPLAPANTSATATGTSVTVRWDDSLTPTVESYNVYRLTAVNATTACPNTTTESSLTTGETPARTYALVTTVTDKSGTSATDAQYSYTDTSLTANTRYCYIVRAVDAADESNNSDTSVAPGTQPAQVNTGAAPTNPGAPTITDVRASDGGLSSLLDAGDVHQFIFNQPMATTVAANGSTYRVTDADGTIADIVCGSGSTCLLEPTGTYNGTNYPANQVMRVNITATPTPVAGGAGTTAGLQYPVTITSVSVANFRDADEGLVLDLTNSPDKVIDTTSGAITPTPNTVAPTLSSASGSGSALTTNWSEGVVGVNFAGFTVHAPADGTCAGAAVATGTAFTSDDGNPQLGVTLNTPQAPATYFLRIAAGSVRDLDGNTNALVACQSVTFTA